MTFIYSIPVHWIWNKNGWLRFTEFEHQNDKEEAPKTRDFAGAGLVHLVSLTSLFLNLRFGIWDSEQKRSVEISRIRTPI